MHIPIALDIVDDSNVSGGVQTLGGDETSLAGALTGNGISVSGGNKNFTLIFDSDGTGRPKDLALSTIIQSANFWLCWRFKSQQWQ